jgi:hypothetical protein
MWLFSNNAVLIDLAERQPRTIKVAPFLKSMTYGTQNRTLLDLLDDHTQTATSTRVPEIESLDTNKVMKIKSIRRKFLLAAWASRILTSVMQLNGVQHAA